MIWLKISYSWTYFGIYTPPISPNHPRIIYLQTVFGINIYKTTFDRRLLFASSHMNAPFGALHLTHVDLDIEEFVRDYLDGNSMMIWLKISYSWTYFGIYTPPISPNVHVQKPSAVNLI